MASIITGLFSSQNQSKKISEDLEKAGFQDAEYIMYLHEQPISKEIKTSIWQSFFRDDTKLEDESLVVSVKVREPEAREKVKQIFAENNAVTQNYIQNIKFKDAESLQYLKRIVSLRAKSQIYTSPEIRHRGQNPGMNSEVFFGKNK